MQVEYALGVKLFVRQRQRLVLTNAGKSYAKSTQKLFEDLDQSALHAVAYGSNKYTHTINLGVLTTFAMTWIIPNLPEFHKLHGNIVVSCFARPNPFDFHEDPLDAAIHCGQSTWPNVTSRKLFDEEMVAVASPDLAEVELILEPRDLARFPLLHESTRPVEWMSWFRTLGLESDAHQFGARFDSFAMIKIAAIAGLGVALVPKILVQTEIDQGILQVIAKHNYVSDSAYCLVYPEDTGENPALEQFATWLVEKCKSYSR